MQARQYFVYILASQSRTLYVGMTNDLKRRLYEHKEGLVASFTRHYRVHALVYYEVTPDVRSAIAREKQIKHWRREKKVALIESRNPGWRDLAEGWFRPVGEAEP
jgi:putative endonuclease